MKKNAASLLRIAGWIPLLPLLALLLNDRLPGAPDNGLKPGEVFPDLAGFGLEGELPAFLKGRVVLVDFWASWCGPCRRTFPLMDELNLRFRRQGLVVLAVNEDKSRRAMTEFLREYPVSFTVVRDAEKRLAAGVTVPSLPTSYLLDRDGKVHSIWSGPGMVQNRKEFIKTIETLLEAPVGKP